MRHLLLSVLLFSSTSFAFAQDLPVVDQVDIPRYMGKWHEIASIPQSFQKQCVSNTTAEYELLTDTNEVKVLNSCQTERGDRSQSEGRAKVTDPTTNAKLKVTFVKIGDRWIYIFGGKYWIIRLDENYQFAIVGHPSRDYGWILSRTPDLPAATLKDLTSFLQEKGYDPCKFLTTPQDGGLTEKKPLCQL
ncbi:lipocalin family protein [Bdellovibrio bacteriovorus]|uniref:lipocalin family protein n=1 Tax=Bdellovibrio bacteriovorus TaxID=959 RepID=UPI0035A68F5C